MKFVALVAILPDSEEENAIDIAKQNGAGAVTILNGRNIGLKEKKIFLGLTLEENVSILIFILPEKLSMQVMKVLRKEFDMDNHDNSSVTFTIPLNHVAGLNNDELQKFEEDVKNNL